MAADASPLIKTSDVAAVLRRPCRKITTITYALTGLAVLAALVAVHFARPILLPVAFALVISMLLGPAASWMDRRRIPQSMSAAVLVGALILGVFGAVYFGGRPAIAWADDLPDTLGEAREKLQGVEDAFRRVNEVSRTVEEFTETEGADEPQEVTISEGSLADSVADSAQAIVIQFTLTAVLVYFFLASRRSSHRKLLALRSSFRTRLRSARIISKVEKNVVGYMLTMLAINTCLGIAVGAAIALLGGPTPIVFGVLAGVLNFIPYVGPTILNILLLVTGLVQEDTLFEAVAPFGAYFILNFIESNIITPSLIGARSRISPLAIILAIAFFTWLWGPAGAVIAIPILIVFKTLCDSVHAMRPIGILLSEDVEVQRPPMIRLRRAVKAAA